MITNQKLLTIKEGQKFLSELPDAEKDMTYVVIGPYCWAKDKNALIAAKNCREHYGKGEYVIHLVNKKCEINGCTGELYFNSKVNFKLNVARFRQ